MDLDMEKNNTITNYLNSTDDILEEMKRLGYPKDAIEYARVQLKEKKDLKFAMGLVKTLTMLRAGKNFLKDVK